MTGASRTGGVVASCATAPTSTIDAGGVRFAFRLLSAGERWRP